MAHCKGDQRISFLVDGETKDKARCLARRSCRSLSGYLWQLLRLHIQEYERLYGPVETKPALTKR